MSTYMCMSLCVYVDVSDCMCLCLGVKGCGCMCACGGGFGRGMWGCMLVGDVIRLVDVAL